MNSCIPNKGKCLCTQVRMRNKMIVIRRQKITIQDYNNYYWSRMKLRRTTKFLRV